MTYSIAQFFLLGALTMIFVGLITAPIRTLALRVGAVDAPTLARKTQKEPIPYLGGVAIAVGIVGASYGSLLAVDFTLENFELASFVLIPAIAISMVMSWHQPINDWLIDLFTQYEIALPPHADHLFASWLVIVLTAPLILFVSNSLKNVCTKRRE